LTSDILPKSENKCTNVRQTNNKEQNKHKPIKKTYLLPPSLITTGITPETLKPYCTG
jgi:hypothetical protein